MSKDQEQKPMDHMHDQDKMDHDMGDMHQDKKNTSDMDQQHGHQDKMKHMDHMHMGHDMAGMDQQHQGHDMGDMHKGQDMSHMQHMHQGHDMGQMAGMDHMHMGHDMSGMAGMAGMAGMHMHMDHGDMKKRFWWSLILMVPILFIAPFMGMDLPFTITFPGSNWLTVILSTILYVVGTKPFFSAAKGELKDKKPAMMSLISMGLIVTYWVSILAFIGNTFFKADMTDYFWEFATLIVIMLLGHLVEMQATMRAGNATAELAKLTPQMAHVKQGDDFKDMPVASLEQGSIVRVLAGESFPADGIITSGETQVDESLMTGESKPVQKAADAKVIGGTINGDGTVEVKVNAVGDDSFVGQLQQTLTETAASSSKAESLANRVAGWLFWVGLIAAVAALIVWTILDGFTMAFNIAITTLIIACPHALGLAIPLVIQRTKAIAAKDGILIENHGAVLSAKGLRYVLMDKTGTLTDGHFSVEQVQGAANLSADDALVLMAALEAQSSHPLAKAIVTAAKDKHLTAKSAADVKTIKGAGVSGTIDQQYYALVSARYLTEQKIPFDALDSTGSISYLTDGKAVLGAVALADQIKDSAADFVAALHQRQLTPVLVTGDTKQTADSIAQKLGIDEVNAEVSPEDKIDLVKRYQQQGKTMMIGDGINDAPALSQADLSVAIGAGTEVAKASADAVLISKSLPKIIDLISLSKHAHEKEIQNLWWGAGYNVLAIPTAAGLLAGVGIMLNPMVGAALMSCSTLIVAANAVILRK
ncbi:copper-translocating P-type ATPase [Leuconostocaceae bacterium ESL0958]|nr:copper-translocating P-type ATPase [Leuconostocaceae bacterium ESL0958]